VKSVVRPMQEGCFETMVAAFCWFAGAHKKRGVIAATRCPGVRPLAGVLVANHRMVDHLGGVLAVAQQRRPPSCGQLAAGTDARLCKAVVDPAHLWGPT
jgi:hypothetical protein